MASDTGAPWNLPYPEDTDLVRDGASDIEALAVATASGLSVAGGLVSAHLSTKTAFSTTSTTFVDVTGFNVTMTPQDATNTIYIWLLIMNMSNGNVNATGFQVNDSTTALLPTPILNTHAGSGFANSGAGGVAESAATTNARTYQVRMQSPSATTATLNGGTLFVFETRV
jgi:hypothetical protein